MGRPGGADMARQPRLSVAGELHHVLLRGHNGQAVFADDDDRAAFTELLREPAARHGVSIHAYALLAAEVHLLATPGQAESLGRLMQSIGRRYVALFNRRHARRGTLWDGRFRTSILDSQTLLLPAMLHIETLPVRAGLAAAAQDWPWSSAAHHSGRGRASVLTDHPLYWRHGKHTVRTRAGAHTCFARGTARGGGHAFRSSRAEGAGPRAARVRAPHGRIAWAAAGSARAGPARWQFSP